MVRAVLLVAGLAQILVGVWAFVDPGSFYDAVAAYPPRNDHFLKDVGSWNIGLGMAAVIASRTPSWQRGMLAVLAVQYGLHAVSHAIDLDLADSEAMGVFTLVTQSAVAILCATLFLTQRSRP